MATILKGKTFWQKIFRIYSKSKSDVSYSFFTPEGVIAVRENDTKAESEVNIIFDYSDKANI